jgi:hypothetical protein
VTDDDLRDLVEQAHLLREFTKDPGYSAWENACKRRIEAKRREMIAGTPRTIEEYRYTAGWIEGAEYALGVLGDLETRIDRERESRKQVVPVTV